MLFKDYITEVPNFPVKGVNFKDISPLLADQETFKSVIVGMGKLVGIGIHYDGKPPDYWIGIDARGFLFASALFAALKNYGQKIHKNRYDVII